MTTALPTTPTDGTDAVPPDFPLPRRCPLRPPEEYAALRERAPVTRVRLRHGRTAWILTRQEHVRELLVHPQMSADRAHPGFPLQVALPVGIDGRRLTSMLGMDEPEHAGVRRLVIPEFTLKRVQAMRPWVQQAAEACLDRLHTGPSPADLVAGYAVPLPSMVICRLLGLPYEDRDFFVERSTTVLSRDATHGQQESAYLDLLEYLERAVTAKERATKERATTEDDLLSRLIAKLRASGRYDRDTVIGMGRLLVVAGHEATSGMIALGAVGLLQRPGLRAELRADPAKWPRVVEELLRYFSISDQSTFRVALADVEIGGVTVRAGEGVIGLNASANWDGAYFDNPEEIDIDRNTGRHLAFGFGPHQCVAQNLARMNIEVALRTLFDRLPGLRLVGPAEDLPFKDDQVVYGLHALPVSW